MSGGENSQNRAHDGPHAAGAAAQGAPDRRADLLPADDRADDQRHDDLLPIAISPLAATGPGRPKGAKNRRTDLVAQYLVDRFGDPLTASMATAGMPLRDLVRELRKVASDCGMKLGASVMDIARFQRDCRNDALPYIHAKRTPETAKGDPVVPVIGIGSVHNTTVNVNAPRRSLEDEVAARAKVVEQSQSVSQTPANVSHGPMSHGEESNDGTDA